MGKYEEALERARQGKPIDEVFPELKESKDERIRKQIEQAIIEHDWSATYKVSKDDCLAYLERQKEPKPEEWSKEDEAYLNIIVKDLKELYKKRKAAPDSILGKSQMDNINWLKALRPLPKQEWSEDDEKMIDDIIRVLTKMAESEDNILPEILPSVARKYVERLKALRPSWKPSVEQVVELRHAISGCSYDIEPLVEIEEHLKKLM